LEVEWVSFEIHPETRAEGVPLAELFPGRAMEASAEVMRRRAEEFDLPYRPSERLSNSRLAIEASELARDQEKFEEFHRAVFNSYFAKAEDIGYLAVLRRLAEEAGLDPEELGEALDSGRYAARRQAVQEEAARYGFGGVPAFTFEGRYAVVGAQPLKVFREVLEKVQREQL